MNEDRYSILRNMVANTDSESQQPLNNSLNNELQSLEDGSTVSMRNKIEHDYTPEDLQYLLGYMAKDRQVLLEPDSGAMSIGGQPYSGPVGGQYKFGSNDEFGSTKSGKYLGVINGQKVGAETRYIPGELEKQVGETGFNKEYGWAAGEKGVNVQDNQMDMLFTPSDNDMLEAARQWGTLDYRTVKRDASGKLNRLDKEAYGSGVTEYRLPGSEGDTSADTLNADEAYAKGKEIYDSLRTGDRSTIFKLNETDSTAEFFKKKEEEKSRKLAEKMYNLTGIAPEGYDPMSKPITTGSQYLDSINEVSSHLYSGGGMDYKSNESSFGNAGKAIAYKLGSSIANTADLVPEAVEYAYGNIVGDKNWSDVEGVYNSENEKSYKEWLGYNDKVMSNLGEQATDAARAAINDGDYTGLAKVIGEGITTPELAGETVGYLLGLILPGGAAKSIVSVASGVNKTANAIKAADKTGKLTKADAIAMAEKEAGTGYKIAKTLAGQTGYANEAEQFGRRAEEEYKELYNEEMPSEQKMAARALGFVYAKTDGIVDKAIVVGKDPVAKAVKELIAKMPPNVQAKMAYKIGTTLGASATRIAGAMGLEGGTEYLQANIEDIAGQYNADKNVGIGDIITNKENIISNLGEGVLGAAGGTQLSLAGQTKDLIYPTMNAVGRVGSKISKKIKPTKTSEPVVENDVDAETVLDENQKAVYETNFADAESRLDALTPLALREDVSNDEYMAGFEEIETIKQHIIDGMRSGTIDKARSDAATAKLKDINAKMHAGAIKMMNRGDEQAMKTLFSDPETAEKRFRSIATSGSEELDLDGANFMKAGFSAGLDEESITDIKDEAKALNALSGRASAGGTEAGGTGKSMSKVAQEVSRDARGYLTYKEMADEGIDAGNVGKINKNLVSMEEFYGKHSAKLDSIDAGLAEATAKAEAVIKNFIENGKANSRNEALIELTALDENKKPKYSLQQIEITYGKTNNKGKINIIDAVRKLKDENYNGGMYSIRESVANETEAMGKVFELTKKRAESIGTFSKQFTDKTETDYVNEIKNLEPEIVKLREKVAKYKLLDEEDLSDNAKASIKELQKMEAKLKAAKDNLAKIKGTKIDNETETSTSTPVSNDKTPVVPKDVTVETPKDTEVKSFIKPPEEAINEIPEPIEVNEIPSEPDINKIPKDTNIDFVPSIDDVKIPKEYIVNVFPPAEPEMPTMVDNEYDFVQAEQEYVEPEDVPTADDIAKFDNIDDIKATTEEEKAVKSKVIEQLEESLENARAKLAKVKEKYSKGREAVNKLVEKRKAIIAEYGDVRESSEEIREEYFDTIDPLNEQIEDAFSKLDTYMEEVVNPYKELVSGLNAKLSGSAEIESIIKDTGLGVIVSEKTKMIEKDKKGNIKYQVIRASEIIKGNKKANNRLSGMKLDDITDNETVIEYANSAVETLAGVIDKVEKKYSSFGKVSESDESADVLPNVNGLESGLKEVQKLRDSLFRGILFDRNGSINRNVATAIAMTGDEFRAIMASKLSYNDKASIAKMLGITEGEVTGLMTRTMAFNGSFKKLIADDLSTTLFKNLAISGVDTADKELLAKMKADAGQMVLLYMQEKGYIEPLTTSTMSVAQYEAMMEKDEDFAKETFTELGESENGATIPMVRLKGTKDANGNRLKGKAKEAYDKKFANETAKLTNTLNVLGATFGIESTKKGYKTKPTKTESKKVKNSKVNNMSDEALDTINVLQSEAFEMNGGVDVLFETDDKGNRLIDDAMILKAMGYKTEAELKGKSFNTIESAEARNMEIINGLDELKSLRARVLDPEDEMTNEMYFDYFFGKNGRFYMDSVGINPQTEKQLHRWLITPKAHKTTIDMKSKVDGDVKKVKMFKLAIAQAFGFAIDKKANAKAYAFAEAIMAADETELLKVLKPDEKGKFEHTFTGSDGKSHTLEVEHLGHTMQAINALRDYRASGGTKFETTMSVEFDAVTSGFIIKLMQLPILKDMKQVKAWLAKGGVFLGGQDGITIGDEQSFNPNTFDKLKSMSDIIDNNWITDAYRTLAGQMKTPKKVDDKFFSNGKKATFANNLLAAMLPMLGDIKEIRDGIDQVTKEGRALFKDPFMTFNYAAGMASIKRSLGYNMTSGFADEMLDEKSSKGNALIAALYGVDYNKIDKAELTRFRNEILTKDFDEVKINGEVKVSELMRKIIEDAYGTQVENILNDEFGPLVEANTIINNSFKGVFLAWKKAYDAEVAKAKEEGGVLSAEVEDEIIIRLKEKFPMINAPLSSGNIEDLETVAIYSSKLQSGKDKTYGAAKTYINKTESENNPKGQQTLTVQSMIREFDAAMSAGAVVPIHYIDGSFMTKVLRASGIVGVHDAIVTGIDGAFDAVKNYNKNVYENSRDYSVIEELHKLVSRNIKGNEDIVVIEAKGKNPAVTFSEIFNELTNLNSEVKERREILFDTDVKVMHMTAIEGTDYSEINGQGTVKKTNKLVEPKDEQIEAENKDDAKKTKNKTSTSGSKGRDTNKLYKGNDGKIKFGDGKWTKQINSFDELFELSSQFDSLLQGTEGVLKKENGGYEYLKEIENMIKNSGVKFNPVQINFEYSKESDASKVGLGLHKPTGGKDKKPKIELFYNGVYESNKIFLDSKYPSSINIESPIRVVLHEYVHALTVTALRSNPALMASAKKLRNHVAKELGIKDAKKFYGIIGDVKGMNIENIKMKSIEESDPFEFIAELMTNPSLQTILGKIPSISNEKSSILEDVKKVFKAIVKFVSNRVDNIEEVNALTDALEIVYNLFDAKVKSESDVDNSTDDIALINESLDIMNTLKKDTKNSNLKSIFESIIEDVKGCI